MRKGKKNMQRTVKSTVVTIALVDKTPEGKYNIREKLVKCFNTNEKNARKKVRKMYPDNIIIDVKEIDELYVMDDETFFAHATLMTPDAD